MSNWKLELARKGAEVLGLDIDDECIYEYACGDGFECRVFNPADDANDRDRLVEYFKIDVSYDYISNPPVWYAVWNTDTSKDYEDTDRTTAINKCLCKMMEIEYD